MWAFEEYVERSREVRDVAGLKALFQSYLLLEGYENHIMTSIGPRKVGNVAWFEFPRGYPETYLAEDWAAIDPVLAHSFRSRRAFLWEEVAAKPTLGKQQRDFLEECRAFGVHSGAVFPLFGPANRCDVISISRRNRAAVDGSRLPHILAVCTQTWWRYVDLTEPSCNPAVKETPLTARETEVLEWVKHGKTNPEIAEIMGLSAKTIEFHVANALNKLRATNRITAVVIALQKGLLSI